jgi:hypothetical protein
MGYTGAVMQRTLGVVGGLALALAALVIWTAVPLVLAERRFGRKDF